MNCTFDPNASPGQFIYRTYRLLYDYFSNLDHNENEVQTWFLMRFNSIDYFVIAILVLFWKYTRESFMKNIAKPCVKYFNVGNRHSQRTEECIWNFVNDVGFWIYIFIITQENDKECNLFNKPSQIFDKIDDTIPLKTKLFYFLQLSKYTFGIYAVLYLDEKRKDFPVMIMHHIVTLILITIGYVSSIVKSGLIVILIHSVSDWFLTSAKILLYSRPKTKIGNNLNKFFLYLMATCFTLTWFMNRLYLYPLRAIYYLSFFPVESSEGRIFGIAYLLLLSIYLMDIYWTYYISKFLIRLFIYNRPFHDPISNEVGSKSESKHLNNQNQSNRSTEIDYKKIH